jgi:hypothetical protein
MPQYNNLRKPFLTDNDEEYQMLLEVADEYLDQKSYDTPQNRSGNATEIVIRNHLVDKGFNVTRNPNVRIFGSNIRNDMLLLKPGVNPHQESYPSSEVEMVIEVKNNAVANQSLRIKSNFDELSNTFPNMRFAAVILSERKGYTHEVTDEKLGDKRYRSFTLVSRRVYPKVGGLYTKAAILEMLRRNEMKKTGDWASFLSYLKE